MAITKAKKAEILEKLEKGLAGAETVAFVNFHKLSVKESTELRKMLRDAGVSFYVAKKTLVRRVLNARKITGTMPEFPGELALAWAADAVSAPKNVLEFVKADKTRKEKVTFFGGIYEGAYLSKEEITALASIPSREVLLGKFVGMLNASVGNVVRVLNERAKSLEGAA